MEQYWLFREEEEEEEDSSSEEERQIGMVCGGRVPNGPVTNGRRRVTNGGLSHGDPHDNKQTYT